MRTAKTYGKRVAFNVGGTRFETTKKTLRNLPNTRLALLTTDDLSYDQDKHEFFFDRNPAIFASVLDFYRFGELHFGVGICPNMAERELEFWGVNPSNFAPCCKLRQQAIDEELARVEYVENLLAHNDHFETQHGKGSTTTKGHTLWRFLEDPTSSNGAKVWAVFFLMTILLSVAIQCGVTSPYFRQPTAPRHQNASTIVNPKMKLYLTTEVYPALLYTDNACLFIFLAELIIRLVLCPRKTHFFKCGFNWIDIISTACMFVLVVYEILNPDFWTNSNKFSVVYTISAFSMFRVLRLFKYASMYSAGRCLLLSLKTSARKIALLLVLFSVGMLIFSNMIYYAEFYSTEDDFLTIPVGFWWAIVTMTTVGYGDKHPHSEWGYFVGALCALVGLLCAALPIPIISSNFNMICLHEKRKELVHRRQEQRQMQCVQNHETEPGGSPSSSPGNLKVTVNTKLNPGYANKVDDQEEASLNWTMLGE